MRESEYWVRLEYRVSAEMAGLGDERFGGFWCDGFEPDEGVRGGGDGRAAAVVGRCWTGKSGQEVWSFTLLLPAGIASREAVDWAVLLPAADVTGWLRLDVGRCEMTVDVAAARVDGAAGGERSGACGG